MLSLGEVGNSVFESSSKVWVRGLAAVARPPAGVDRQLLQVGEAPFLGNPSDLTRGQNRKAAQVDLLCAFRLQVVVEKPVMTDLIVSVVADVLRHIAVEYQKSRDVVWSEPPGKRQIDRREALISCSAEFGVLNPQVGLDLFQGAQEGQDCDIALCDRRAVPIPAKCRRGAWQQRRTYGCGPRSHHSVCQECAPVCWTFHAIFRLLHCFSPFPRNCVRVVWTKHKHFAEPT